MTDRENYLATAQLRGGEWIPCGVSVSPATWAKYREDLEDVLLRHPTVYHPLQKGQRDFDAFGPAYREGERFTDNWGCVWLNIQGGLEGQVVEHPLADWSALDTYRLPDPLRQHERGDRGDWGQVQAAMERQRAEGRLTWGGGDRFFERLHFLRGFENLMVDLATDPPQLARLIRLVVDHNMALVRKWLEIGVEVMSFGDDLGMQDRAMMRPEIFRRHLKPGYAEMFQPCRAAGSQVYLHSDGHILELMDDLIEAGITIINPQVRANGMDNLAREVKGRIAISLDLDRQNILPFGSPADVRDHVKEAVLKLGSPRGGLMVNAEINPTVPLANVDAVCSAFEELRTYWADHG